MKPFLPFMLIPLLAALSHAATLDEIAAKPPATGVLVLSSDGDVLTGDIVTAIDDKPLTDIKELWNLAERGGREKEKANLTLLRDGKTRQVVVPKQPLIITGIEVEAGKATSFRPPATDIKLEFADLLDAPRNVWYGVYKDGKKIGYQHHTVSARGDRVIFESTIVSMGKPEETSVMRCYAEHSGAAKPAWLYARYDIEKGGTTTISTLNFTDGKVLCEIQTKNEKSKRELAMPPGAMPAAGFISFFGSLPLEEDKCLHFTEINPLGEAMTPQAALVGKVGELEKDDIKIKLVPISILFLGRAQQTLWVHPDLRMVVRIHDQADARDILMRSKEEALRDVPENLIPKAPLSRPATTK